MTSLRSLRVYIFALFAREKIQRKGRKRFSRKEHKEIMNKEHLCHSELGPAFFRRRFDTQNEFKPVRASKAELHLMPGSVFCSFSSRKAARFIFICFSDIIVSWLLHFGPSAGGTHCLRASWAIRCCWPGLCPCCKTSTYPGTCHPKPTCRVLHR